MPKTETPPRFCPDCKRTDTYRDPDTEVLKAKYPPVNQAMLPLSTPGGQVVPPHEYGVCADCHAKQYAKFYEIEQVKNPTPVIEDIYAVGPAKAPVGEVTAPV